MLLGRAAAALFVVFPAMTAGMRTAFTKPLITRKAHSFLFAGGTHTSMQSVAADLPYKCNSGLAAEHHLWKPTDMAFRGADGIPAMWLGPATRQKWTALSMIPEGNRMHVSNLKENDSNVKDDEEVKRQTITWEDKFALLRHYKKEHGNCNPPGNYVTWNGVKLGGWVATQRKEFQKHQAGLYSAIINDKRILRLERAGFEWEDQTVCTTHSTAMKLAVSLCKNLLQKLTQTKHCRLSTSTPGYSAALQLRGA